MATTTPMIRTYSELIRLQTFEERYEYLKLNSRVGQETFGFDRYLNQRFYKTGEWLSVRDKIIARDNGWDLGVRDYDIMTTVYIHHMNPILLKDLVHKNDILLDPEYLISTSLKTHNAIHYGAGCPASGGLVERSRNDTSPWKR